MLATAQVRRTSENGLCSVKIHSSYLRTVVDKYIYSTTICRAHSQREDESEAISLTSHRVYIREDTSNTDATIISR